jgi:predicted nucleotidyltransferase
MINPMMNYYIQRRIAFQELIHPKPKTLTGKISFMISPSGFIKKKTESFAGLFHEGYVKENCKDLFIRIEPYQGNNITAIALKNHVLAQVHDDIDEILIHGSIAEGTACDYSDFDCLIILKDEVIKSKSRLTRLVLKLRKWQRLMLQTDILQHHGWFFAFLSDFDCWDQSYLPAEVFQHARSLLHKDAYSIKISVPESCDFKTPFLKLCDELLSVNPKQIQRMNLYELKSFISRFFLMPALYYQARHQSGIYKRDSFRLAKADFTQEIWRPVEELSALRMRWQQPCSHLTRKLISTFYLCPSSAKRWLYPKAPVQVKNTVLENLKAIKNLLEAMNKNVS